MAATQAIKRELLSVTAVRKLSNCGATLLAAIPLLLMVWLPGLSTTLAIVMMMASYGLNSLGYTGYHVNHIDLTPRYAPLLCEYRLHYSRTCT